MKQYFECHVTMTGDPEFIEPLVENLKWKFSVINGDPVLGRGLKCYATRLFNIRMGQEGVQNELLRIADALSNKGCNVIRRKVEMVIYDDRINKVKCTGGCPECHLDDLTHKQ